MNDANDYSATFAMIDTDGDGLVSLAELTAFLQTPETATETDPD